MTMGERIRDLRKQHKMSMEELGKHLNIGKSAILKYENGSVENIPRSTIEKMAVLFGVTPSYLMCFDEWDKNSDALSDEVILIERIQAKWGKDVVTLLHLYDELNDEGKYIMMLGAENLSLLDKYKKSCSGCSK